LTQGAACEPRKRSNSLDQGFAPDTTGAPLGELTALPQIH